MIRLRAPIGIAMLALAAGACSTTSPPQSPMSAPGVGCATVSAAISFDFKGAPQGRCRVDSERAFTVLVEPEHPPPINPSPWYAFRYAAEPGEDVRITLDYGSFEHRYPPELRENGSVRELSVTLTDEGRLATFFLPPGNAQITAQELYLEQRYDALLTELVTQHDGARFSLGQSIGGRPVEALRLGTPEAPHLIMLLGRAHPPEVSGAVAMESFLLELANVLSDKRNNLGEFQVLAVPLLNPDGVARGHWRANMGEIDLNRDWGFFTQPETQAVHAWLTSLPPNVSPVVMLDFHSTSRNLFYVQGKDETTQVQEAFFQQWLVPIANDFTLERRNANPGSGTSKNWFHATYGIPAYTYEVADEAVRAEVETIARLLADRFVSSLEILVASDKMESTGERSVDH